MERGRWQPEGILASHVLEQPRPPLQKPVQQGEADPLGLSGRVASPRVTCFLMLCRDFRVEDGKAVIPLDVAVQGDVLVVIYHARSTLGGRLQAKVSSRVAPACGPS